MGVTPSTGPGRKRSEESRAAILAAAFALFEQTGWPQMTMEGIAREAGVSKATIYRWWPDKAAVLMDALVERSDVEAAFPDSGDALADLAKQLKSVIRLFTRTPQGRALLTLIAESQHSPELVSALRDRLISARRAGARALLERGIASGQLREDLDTEVAIDAVYGALYYRLLVSHEKTTPKYADRLLEQLRPALRVH